MRGQGVQWVFFYGFDVKNSELKNDIQRVIDSKEIKLGDLQNYVKVIIDKGFGFECEKCC